MHAWEATAEKIVSSETSDVTPCAVQISYGAICTLQNGLR